MQTSTCKGCGAKIVWAVTPDGKKIPIDPKPPIYRYSEDGYGNPVAHRAEQAQYYDKFFYGVSHFATCPKASDFSASKRQGG